MSNYLLHIVKFITNIKGPKLRPFATIATRYMADRRHRCRA
jgi:hypothetical protein